MFISKSASLAIIMVLMLLNASCSSDSSTDSNQESDAGLETGDTNDTPDDSDDGLTTDDDDTGTTGTAGLFGPAQYIISECNSAGVTTAEAPNDVNNPTLISTEQLVKGQLSEDSSVLSFDVWQISLQPGNYHLIVDSWMVSEESGSHGVRVTSLGDTTDNDERLMSTAASGFSERGYEFLEILNPTTMRVKVEPTYGETMNYVMGIFPNGSSVPSPRFTECPSITTLSLETTASVPLNELTDAEDQRWFRLDLGEGVYTLDVSLQSGESPLGYRVELMQQFGEDESERVASEAASTTPVTSSDEFTVLNDGDVWLRVENVYRTSGNLELTVNR
jgi:hypothetical protein